MWLKLTRNGIKLDIIEHIIVYYRIHSDSIYGAYKHLLLDPADIKNKSLRERYINLNITFFYKLDYLVKINYKICLSILVFNSKNRYTNFIYRVLSKYGNPAFYATKIFNSRIIVER
jgi:hypothetical protein